MDYKKPVRFRGVPFEYGDEVLIVPPLTGDQAIRLAKEIDLVTCPAGLLKPEESMKLDAGAFSAYMDTIRQRDLAKRAVIQAAIYRNYPELPADDLSEFITKENEQDLFNVAMAYPLSASAPKEKIKDPGEYQAGRGALPSTGPTPPAVSLPA